MKPVKLLFLNLLFVLCVLGDDSIVHTDSFSRTTHFPKVEEARKWKALDWDSDTWAGFEGRPWIEGVPNSSFKLIKHKRFVVNYDVNLLNPRWTAHVDTRDSALATAKRPNSKPEWKRPSRFIPDPFLVTIFKKLNRAFVTHDDFSNSGYSRGHMTSNAEMKGFDQESQVESFLTSNICPQLQDHNGGVWAALEEDCLKWAKAFGKVYVFTGPIFEKDPVKRVKNKMGVPDKFFKVLIAEKEGELIATGFLIDHKNGFKKSDLFKFQVAVDEIEKESKIDFMPLMGEPNEVEGKRDDVWKTSLGIN